MVTLSPEFLLVGFFFGLWGWQEKLGWGHLRAFELLSSLPRWPRGYTFQKSCDSSISVRAYGVVVSVRCTSCRCRHPGAINMGSRRDPVQRASGFGGVRVGGVYS